MKKLMFLIILALTNTNNVYPQWVWQNPLPQGNTINDVDFLNSFFGIAIGNTNTILKTTDGGIMWALKDSPVFENIHKVDVISNEVAYALGYYFIIKTTDGGENWFTINDPTSSYLNDIFFLYEMKGYIVGSGSAIYYTEDGGITWIIKNTVPSVELKSVDFLNENIGMVVGDNASNYETSIFKTTDGGLTWIDYSFSPYPYSYTIKDLAITTPSKAFIISSRDLLYSTDGGENWSLSSISTTSYFNSITFFDSLSGFIAGFSSINGDARIFRTSDGGSNWQEIIMNLGNSLWLNGISFPTENCVFAVGGFGIMVYSNDSGNNWVEISSGFLNSFNDVAFYNEYHGIAVGDGIAVTTNGGETWVLNQSAGGYRCSMPSENIVFTAGGYNLQKSTDGGFTWTRHTISDEHYFMTISFADTLNGITSAVLGPQAKIFRTFDGGENWQQITSIQGYYIYDICFVDPLTAYASSGSTNVFKTTDGGYTWDIQYTGVSGTILNGIHFVNKDIGYTVGYPGVVIKTTNGGQNWQLLNPNLGSGLAFYQVHFKDENNGLVAGDIVAHTSDGGQNWNGYDLFNEFMTSASMVNDSVWYAVGEYGAILKTTKGGVVPVELFSFTSRINGQNIILSWATATETNNQGFEVQRKASVGDFVTIGFIQGEGTTTEQQDYSFIDKSLSEGKYSYRLKQIDYDGTFEYSKTIEVEIHNPIKFSLSQNYPNPFNPSTKISWQSPVGSWQTLKVYDVLGNLLTTLIDEYKPAGSYEVEFNVETLRATSLPSSVYFYQLKAGSFVETKKMILLK